MTRGAAACAVILCLAGCAGGARESANAGDRYTEYYRRLHPSVVLFTMHIPADDPRRKGKYDKAYGSGVVVESGDWGSRILTDAHVVADARDLVVRIGDGKKAPAHVAAVSSDDEDVAIVDTRIPNAAVAHLGSSKNAEPGRPIGVLGYPIPDAFEDERLGTTASLYTGRIASVRKGALELDVPIIPGESGGPVFDGDTGDIIGIAESRFEEERAIGFATPIDVAVKFLAAHPRRP
ncbi:MAG: trypsin-like peptidase domain-containing protein [Candidatus Velthaea sp.]